MNNKFVSIPMGMLTRSFIVINKESAMNLYDYLEKRVRILSRTGRSFEGVADEYFYPHETEYGEESISITTDDGDCVEFYEDDIKHIEVL